MAILAKKFIDMENYNYPNEAVPDEVKHSVQYGKSVGKYIENQWFGHDNRYFKKRSEMLYINTHMKGDINIASFFDVLGIDKDASNIALNWKPPRIISKFINNVVDGFSEEVYGIKVRGIDPIHNQKRAAYTETLKKAMVTKAFTDNFNQAMGTSMGLQEPVPEDEDELNLHMELDYHPLSEAIAEIAPKNVMEMNNYEEVKKQCDEDLVKHGEAGMRVKRVGAKISVERLQPENTIYSYDWLDARDGRGTLYYGRVLAMSIGELKKIVSAAGHTLTDEEIQKLTSTGKSYMAMYNNKNTSDGRVRSGNNANDDKLTVLVIDFAYKTTNHIVHKKKYDKHGGYKLIKKDDSFNPGASKDYERLQTEYDVWYEGLYVLGTGDLYNYGVMDNQARKLSNLREPVQPFIYYKLSTESIGNRILPYAEQIYITFMKIQQLVAKMRPDGVAIDMSALSDIDLMDGTKFSTMDIMSKFSQEGDLLYDGERLDGSYGARPPITDMPAPVSQKLQQLVSVYLHWVQAIRDDTGINEARDASTPDPKALVGVQKLSLLASLNSTKHIMRGMLDISKRVAESILLQLQLMSRYRIYDKQLINMIGSYNQDALKELVDMGNYEYQIILQIKPTAEEEAQFEREMQLALQANQISLADVSYIRDFDNIHLKRAYFRVKTKKYIQMMQQQQQQQQQALMQAEQMKLKSEIDKDALMTQTKMKYDKFKVGLETKKEMDLILFKLQVEKKFGSTDFDKKKNLEDIKHQQRTELEGVRQDRLDKRATKTKTQESELINQREKKSAPKDFDNEDLGISEFMMSEEKSVNLEEK